MTSTKDVENKTTLLHYLVETIERKFPDLLTFEDELRHVDRAARVAVDSIQKALRQMDSSVRNLETDLNNCKVPQGEDDKFVQVMGVSFICKSHYFYCLINPRISLPCLFMIGFVFLNVNELVFCKGSTGAMRNIAEYV